MTHAMEGSHMGGIIRRCILYTCISIHQTVEAYHATLTRKGYSLHLAAVARLETYGCGGRYVQMAAKGCITVELQITIHLKEVEVRANLNGAVTRIADCESLHWATFVVD